MFRGRLFRFGQLHWLQVYLVVECRCLNAIRVVMTLYFSARTKRSRDVSTRFNSVTVEVNGRK